MSMSLGTSACEEAWDIGESNIHFWALVRSKTCTTPWGQHQKTCLNHRAVGVNLTEDKLRMENGGNFIDFFLVHYTT